MEFSRRNENIRKKEIRSKSVEHVFVIKTRGFFKQEEKPLLTLTLTLLTLQLSPHLRATLSRNARDLRAVVLRPPPRALSRREYSPNDPHFVNHGRQRHLVAARLTSADPYPVSSAVTSVYGECLPPPSPMSVSCGERKGGVFVTKCSARKRPKCTSWKTQLFISVGTGGGFFMSTPAEFLNGEVKIEVVMQTHY